MHIMLALTNKHTHAYRHNKSNIGNKLLIVGAVTDKNCLRGAIKMMYRYSVSQSSQSNFKIAQKIAKLKIKIPFKSDKEKHSPPKPQSSLAAMTMSEWLKKL